MSGHAFKNILKMIGLLVEFRFGDLVTILKNFIYLCNACFIYKVPIGVGSTKSALSDRLIVYVHYK